MANENTSRILPRSGNKIIVHHLNNSRSQRIIWLMEELETPYEIKNYERTPEMLAPPELRSVNPLGETPVITDGDLRLAESGAIVEYLITKYGGEKFKPTEAGWLDNLYCDAICKNHLETSVEPGLKVNRAFIENHLAKSSTGWFANGPNPTSADFMMLFPMEVLRAHVPSSGRSTAVEDYLNKIRERPAFKRAVEKGGEVEFM